MKSRVTIVGGGLMGCGIAACSALAGHETVVVESRAEARQEVWRRVADCVDELRSGGLAGQEAASGAKELLRVTDELAPACQGAALVVEAIVEDLAAKQALFCLLDAAVPAGTPIVSNTSGLRITDIARNMEHPERAATAHFWFPAHLVPLVEVVLGDRTEEPFALQVRDLLRSWGKEPVLVRKDLPGQLANRILQAMIREAVHIVEIGLASPEDVDRAVKMGMGIRMPAWGPLEHLEAVGLDLGLRVQQTVLPEIDGSAVPSPHLQRLVEEGRLGYKTGGGFYRWSGDEMERLTRRRNECIIEARKLMQKDRNEILKTENDGGTI